MHGSRNERRSCPDPWTSSNLAVVLANANVSLQLTSGETLAVVIACWTFLCVQETRRQLRARSFPLPLWFCWSFLFVFCFTFVIRIRSRGRPLSFCRLLVVPPREQTSNVQWRMIKTTVHKKIIWSWVRIVLLFCKLESSCRFFPPSVQMYLFSLLFRYFVLIEFFLGRPARKKEKNSRARMNEQRHWARRKKYRINRKRQLIR